MKMATLVSVSRVSHPISPTANQLTKKIDIIMAREVKTAHSFGEKPWLGFECVTMTPMCRKLIDEKYLTPREVTWLNTYHADVLEKTRSYFDGKDELTMKWLERETRPL